MHRTGSAGTPQPAFRNVGGACMAKGMNYGNESLRYTDEITGASVIRLTGHPTIHSKLYMHIRAIAYEKEQH